MLKKKDTYNKTVKTDFETGKIVECGDPNQHGVFLINTVGEQVRGRYVFLNTVTAAPFDPDNHLWSIEQGSVNATLTYKDDSIEKIKVPYKYYLPTLQSRHNEVSRLYGIAEGLKEILLSKKEVACCCYESKKMAVAMDRLEINYFWT